MKYQIDHIRQEGVTLEGVLESQPENTGSVDAPGASAITYTVHLNRSGTTVFVKGVVTATVALSCSRCLESFDFPLTSEFSFSLIPEVPETKPCEKELQAEDLETEFYDGEAVDVEKIVQNSVQLGLPIKPLCRPDCRGICPACGANKNLDTCTCSIDNAADPRLAGLRNFFSKRNER